MYDVVVGSELVVLVVEVGFPHLCFVFDEVAEGETVVGCEGEEGSSTAVVGPWGDSVTSVGVRSSAGTEDVTGVSVSQLPVTTFVARAAHSEYFPFAATSGSATH